MRYTGRESNYQYGYRHKCIYDFLSTASKFFVAVVFAVVLNLF